MNARTWRISGAVAAALVAAGAITAVQAQATEPAVKAPVKGSATADFRDDFTTFDRSVWSCEYDCPVIEGEKARFRLKSGIKPDQYGSWSKAKYKKEKFTSGEFTVRFSLTDRPKKLVDDKKGVWWGVALWDNGPVAGMKEFNEINFGYTTNQSFTNTQLLFESAKRGRATSIRVDTGVNLYDEQYHEATLEYDKNAVKFYLDGKLLETITDKQYIPTDPMSLILGPRLVTGSQPLAKGFTESIDWVTISK
ncbi:glycoside hydrolase family 16 protein [Kineosporia rhizophila]|uniref:glycoside hydrolase family 16 protein n=1 Tax=Kineosporia rhizophila TaxID=84633 RepID=UPI001E2C95FF|nr:glycoside hydrolase family 16 protein [Kineosporia rhizophila]MCE0539844.1 glycoside hydrolase family 16 protein [Kineosporia rhizophila]